jgi:recombinational DNA repair protein (RecF pathway)
MAQRRGGYQGSFERCGRCKGIASKWSVYSDRMLCNSCLSFERTAHEIQEARQATELEQAIALEAYHAGLEADYRDERETMRDLRQGAVQ